MFYVSSRLSPENVLQKLKSETLPEKDLDVIANFWGYKYKETTGVDHLKLLVSNEKLS